MCQKVLRSVFAAAVAGLLITTPSLATAPGGAFHANFTRASAWYFFDDLTVPCWQYQIWLDVVVGSRTTLAPGGQLEEWRQAGVTWDWVDTCRNETVLQMTGQTAFGPDDYTIDGLNSMTISNVTVEAYSSGYTQFYTLDLAWTGNGDISPEIILNGVQVPSPGNPPAGASGNWVGRRVTASVAGTISGNSWTAAGADIAQVTLVSPPSKP